jgi:hypothetical protein
MSSKTGIGLVAAGVIATFAGLACFPAALRDGNDTNVFSLGVCLFSIGMLLAASGTYLNARLLSRQQGPEAASSPARRVRGGCELCAGETPAIRCKTHQLQMCASCLAQHYDVRSCVYVPLMRSVASGSAKAMAKARGF